MRYVGVRNSPEKARLLERGVAHRVDRPVADLAYDCIRHRAFVELVLAGADPEAWRASLYWRFMRHSGRSPESADGRCRRFAELIAGVRRDGLDPDRDPIAVTDDGIRLDGSHRVAIAATLGTGTLAVDEYAWDGTVAAWRRRHVAEEARVKRETQDALLGRDVAAGGSPAGRVAFVDAEVPGRLSAALGARARGVVVVEDAAGALTTLRADAVTLL